jgi:ElaB/YqjD/DUF883 family membrane-anchored ribosome-binding protein
MSDTFDAIGDRVSPGRMAERRWNRVRVSTVRMRESVMGTPRRVQGGLSQHSDDTSLSRAQDRTSGLRISAEETASSAAAGIAGTVQGAPDAIKEGTQGNPLMAGGIAFGVGMLLGSLAPPSREETMVAERLMEPVKEQLTEVGHQIADTTKAQAQEGMEQTKAVVSDAAATVKQRSQDL